jgi:hypothetical protein
MMSERTAFLLPVVIDATRDAEADVPAEFRIVQWTRQPDGEATPAFCTRVEKLLAPAEAVADMPSIPLGRPIRSASRANSRPWFALAGLVAIAVIAAVVWRSSQRVARPDQDAREAHSNPKPALPDKSIAVLPFTNSSDDKENTAFFADGMHEDILTNLANVRELRVISRTSVMEYRGTTKKITQIARDLGVRTSSRAAFAARAIR